MESDNGPRARPGGLGAPATYTPPWSELGAAGSAGGVWARDKCLAHERQRVIRMTPWQAGTESRRGGGRDGKTDGWMVLGWPQSAGLNLVVSALARQGYGRKNSPHARARPPPRPVGPPVNGGRRWRPDSSMRRLGDGEDRSGVAIRRQEPSGVCLCRGGEATWGAWKVDRDLQPLCPSFATLWQRFAKPVLAGATLPVMVSPVAGSGGGALPLRLVLAEDDSTGTAASRPAGDGYLPRPFVAWATPPPTNAMQPPTPARSSDTNPLSPAPDVPGDRALYRARHGDAATVASVKHCFWCPSFDLPKRGQHGPLKNMFVVLTVLHLRRPFWRSHERRGFDSLPPCLCVDKNPDRNPHGPRGPFLILLAMANKGTTCDTHAGGEPY
ncbi:hypothetical protein PCL_10194 [Purpureocillium lilacinum]|uniref:Uncharacterized protein n=1 Tax=Purpureocillium lilacinum TaxID=33203 RepID=A0A2U3EF85_PURLI|nr:hypothetical protein PCL_10194 [Purpureocillium lilacinum]